MFATVTQIRSDLAGFATSIEWSALDGRNVTLMLAELATMKRLVDGLIAQAARRANDTNAHASTADRSGVALAARLAGVEPAVMANAVKTAQQLDALPATAAAVKMGKLSAREAELVAGAATADPSAESKLLALTSEGIARLKDECQRVRAHAEDADARRKRMHASRTLRMWSDADGMLHGRFALPTEIGAQIKANIDREVQRIFRERRRGTDREPHDRYAVDALCAFVMHSAKGGEANDANDAAEPANDASESANDVGGAASGTDANDPSKSANDASNAPNSPATEGERRRSSIDVNPVRTNATVHVLIDHAALVRGVAASDETCEIPGVGPVDVSWVQSLLGSAFVTAIIKRGRDICTVAHLGRHIPAQIQTALIVSPDCA